MTTSVMMWFPLTGSWSEGDAPVWTNMKWLQWDGVGAVYLCGNPGLFVYELTRISTQILGELFSPSTYDEISMQFSPILMTEHFTPNTPVQVISQDYPFVQGSYSASAIYIVCDNGTIAEVAEPDDRPNCPVLLPIQ